MPDHRSSRSLRPLPPVRSRTSYAFPSSTAMHSTFVDSDGAKTDLKQQSLTQRLAEMALNGANEVEISDLLRLSVYSPLELPEKIQIRWEVLNAPAIKPKQIDRTTAEVYIPDTDADQLIVAATLLFPDGVNHQLVKPVIVSGTNLPSLIRSFQQTIAEGQFSPRLTKRLADSLYRARQAQGEGSPERLGRHLHRFVKDCWLILKKKKSPQVTVLYHRARWLERQAKRYISPKAFAIGHQENQKPDS